MAVESVADLAADAPRVVSVSDIHGYTGRFESALLTLADHPDFAPVVERQAADLRWVGGDDVVLVVGGDVVNRGPDSAGSLELLADLRRQAPAGHVRWLLGNHDLALPYPSPPEWDRFWADGLGDECRRAFWQGVLDGDVLVAFEGHRYTYSHAGSPDGVDPPAVNERLRNLARTLIERVGDDGERGAFERVVAERMPEIDVPDVDEAGQLRKTPDAGVVWLDWSFLDPDSPPQVVGHTPHETVQRRGNVVCADTILANADSPGGEALVVETPGNLRALVREPDGGVRVRDLSPGVDSM